MRTLLILTFFTLHLSKVYAQQDQAIPYEVTLDHSKQFWITSKHVGDQYLIKVYLPESYFKSNKKYPVIYLTDGDRYFGIASGLMFTQLFQRDFEAILVGIGYGSVAANSDKRGRDFQAQRSDLSTHGCDAFLSFLGTELIPEVENRFRIKAKNRTLVGWSRGATFTLYALFQQPDLFRNYVALSAEVNYKEWSIVEEEQRYSVVNDALPATLFYSIGSDDKRSKSFPAFKETLVSRNYKGFKLKEHVLPGKRHDGIALAEGFGLGLKFIYGDR